MKEGNSNAAMETHVCDDLSAKGPRQNAGAQLADQLAERIVRYVLCDLCHVGCLRTLLTLNDLELHTIAFGEGFKTAA